MTIEKHKYKTLTRTQSSRKGKYATSTENRRLMWEYIIWPLVLELNKNYFIPGEYHKMRDKVSIEMNIPISKMSGGLVSLLIKGILTQDQKYYSIHYKLIPYMRKKVHLDYETVLREVRSKK
jgi:high-affinity Fe2+/Pb2+ permease